jgi:peroxiredoxin
VTQLNFNDPAPDATLVATTGEAVTLSGLWAKQTLLLVFTRHFGCTQCKEMLDRLSLNKDQLAQAGLHMAVVTQGTVTATLAFCQQYAPATLCLADPDRKAYAAYKLERGNLFQTVLSPAIWQAVRQAEKKGYHLEPPPPGQDALQMSGLFIIGTDGRIRLPYYYDTIADHPQLELLFEGVLSTDWARPLGGPLGPTA